MPFEPERDARKIATYVGLPADQDFDLSRFEVPLQRPDAHDYRLFVWGLRAEWDGARHDWDGARLDDEPPPWPSMTASVTVGREPVTAEDGTQTFRLIDETRTYQLWLIQAYRPGFPLAAERRWHPDLGIRDAIVGIERESASDADWAAARRGHALILAHQEESERKRRWAALSAVTVGMMTTRVLELEERDCRRPSQEALAASYNVGRSALTRWLGDRGLTWPDFLAKVPSRR